MLKKNDMELIMISCVILAIAIYAVIDKLIRDKKIEKLEEEIEQLRKKRLNKAKTKCDG
jgi:hypothetical protein